MSEDLKDCIRELEKLCGQVELVSFGLAPNPFGFCYEVLDSEADVTDLDASLECLSDEDEITLRSLYL